MKRYFLTFIATFISLQLLAQSPYFNDVNESQKPLNINSDVKLLMANALSQADQTRTKHEFNVQDYGALGSGDNHDDTEAFQRAINACILAKGKLIIPPPAEGGFYNITSTLSIKHPTESECFMDMEGFGTPRMQIKFSGAAGTSCFKIIGLRFSIWKGLKIALNNNANTVALELDTYTPTSSTSFITFINCQVALGKGIGQVGWKLGLLSKNGGDISCLLWQNCSVFGDNRDINGQIGWSIRGGNTLHNVWVQCFGAHLNTMVSNKDGGNGANYFYGMGTSGNNLDYYIQNTSNWLIEGGRYENGRKFLEVGQDNKSPSIMLQGLAIGNYDGINGNLMMIDMPCSLEMSGVQVAQKRTGNWNNQMIKLYGRQYGVNKAIGRLIIDGGSITTDARTFYSEGTPKVWKKYIRAVGKMAKDGVVTHTFAELNGIF